MSDQKIKTASGKPPLALVPMRAVVGPSRVYGYGAKKYVAGNFYQATLEDGAGARYVSAALRHLSEMQEPNGLHTAESLAALDPESGLPHLDHVLCGLMMLRTIMIKCGALPEDPGEGKEPPNLAVVDYLESLPKMPVNLDLSTLRIENLRAEVAVLPCVAPDDACDCRDCVRRETTAPLEMILEPDAIHPPGDPPKTGCSCAECSWLGLGGK